MFFGRRRSGRVDSSWSSSLSSSLSVSVPSESDIRRVYWRTWWLIDKQRIMRRFVSGLLVLVVFVSLLVVLWSGVWERWPLLERFAPVPTVAEVSANLSLGYGNITVMRIEADSMFPSFYDGHRVLVATQYYQNVSNQPRVGEVVAFRVDEEYYIKRIAFVAGDTFSQSGNFLLAGSGEGTAGKTDLAIASSDVVYGQIFHYGLRVPNNTLIVLGDNPSNSLDSRSFGLISVNSLKGKVVN